MIIISDSHQLSISEFDSESSGASMGLVGVTYSPELDLYAAVGKNTIQTSPDGLAWTEKATPNSEMQKIDWSPSLGLFVAVGRQSYVDGTGLKVLAKSDDGETWTITTVSEEVSWIRWSPEAGKFYGSDITIPDFVSTTDGLSWASAGLAGSHNIAGFAYSPELGRILLANSSGGVAKYSDDNGVSWQTESFTGDTPTIGHLAYSPKDNLFVASYFHTGTLQTFYSSDGVHWSKSNNSIPNVRNLIWIPEYRSFLATRDVWAVAYSSVNGKDWSSPISILTNVVDWKWIPNENALITVSLGSPYAYFLRPK